jgi:putative flippase GtrA
VARLGRVTFLRAMYARFRDLIHEGARFGVVGFVGLVVTDGFANLLRYHAGLGELTSFAIGIVIATVVTFVGNRFWTYRHRERTGLRRETALFFGVNGVGVAISEVPVVLTYLLHRDGGLAYNLAINGGNALATLFRYWSYKRWVWRTGAAPAVTTQPAPAHRHSASTHRPRRLLRLISRTFSQLSRELALFSLVGASAFLVADAGTVLLHFEARVGPVTSKLIAIAVAVVVSYAGNRYWTFRRRQRRTVAREGPLFVILTTAGLAVQLTCLGFSTYMLGLQGKLAYNIALVTAIGLGGLFRYCSYRTWLWRSQPSPLQSRRSGYAANGAI